MFSSAVNLENAKFTLILEEPLIQNAIVSLKKPKDPSTATVSR